MIGQTIQNYRILEKLGEGGMGVVYRAEDLNLKRTVALKFLPKGLEALEPEPARLTQEAQAASALNHPNICAIHDLTERNTHPTKILTIMIALSSFWFGLSVPMKRLHDDFDVCPDPATTDEGSMISDNTFSTRTDYMTHC